MTQPTTLALYLAANIHHIAADENAGQIYNEIHQIVDTIERMINRPYDPKYCGPCPHINDDQTVCDVALYAEWDDKTKQYEPEVVCWKCHTTYTAEQLINDAINEVDGWLFTAAEILDTMKSIGEPISDRTWRHWRKTGAIQSRNELGAEPKYFIGEVRHLRKTHAKLRAA